MTNLKKYGVDNPMKNDEIKNKSIQILKNKYGEKFEKILNKTRQTMLDRYGYEYALMNTDILKIVIEKSKIKRNKKLNQKIENLINIDNDNNVFDIYCEKCNFIFNISNSLYKNRKRTNTIICTICNPIGSSKSGYEIQLQDFIKENYSNNILINRRKIIPPLELDIYLPELKLAFEFNDIYWHNEEHKSNNYHLNKTEECEKQGIQLIHIWEDNWIYKQDIVKSMILNKLGKTSNKIYGRKTEVKEITDNKLVRNFLETNHLQGFIGSKVKLGLFFNDELVSLMTFGKRRVAMGKKSTNDGEFELLRFCNKLNTNVLGGASKLFKYFKNNYNPKEITTYADRSHSIGGLYKQLGFDFIGTTTTNYYYIIDGIRYHRFNFRKDKLIKEGFDPNKTEHQIMIDRKIFRIYDSGNLKYELHIS
jgi:very-short-patch-repair endonuclease